jgi:ligand-binding sensor protein
MLERAKSIWEVEAMKNKALVLHQRTGIDWRIFEKELYQHFGVNAVTYGKDGYRRTSNGVDLVNSICVLIKKHPKGNRLICNDVQRRLTHEAHAKKRFAADECAAGMYKIVVPVLENDAIEGFVSACGRPFLSTDRIYTHYIHKTIDQDEEEIRKLLSTLVPINPRTIRELVAYITSYG